MTPLCVVVDATFCYVHVILNFSCEFSFFLPAVDPGQDHVPVIGIAVEAALLHAPVPAAATKTGVALGLVPTLPITVLLRKGAVVSLPPQIAQSLMTTLRGGGLGAGLQTRMEPGNLGLTAGLGVFPLKKSNLVLPHRRGALLLRRWDLAVALLQL